MWNLTFSYSTMWKYTGNLAPWIDFYPHTISQHHTLAIWEILVPWATWIFQMLAHFIIWHLKKSHSLVSSLISLDKSLGKGKLSRSKCRIWVYFFWFCSKAQISLSATYSTFFVCLFFWLFWIFTVARELSLVAACWFGCTCGMWDPSSPARKWTLSPALKGNF